MSNEFAKALYELHIIKADMRKLKEDGETTVSIENYENLLDACIGTINDYDEVYNRLINFIKLIEQNIGQQLLVEEE